MDSLYQGYPIGYIIAWKIFDINNKDNSYQMLLYDFIENLESWIKSKFNK